MHALDFSKLPVITCGSVPLETSYQRVNHCIYASTSLYEYRGWKSKPSRVGHRLFTWGLRYLEILQGSLVVWIGGQGYARCSLEGKYLYGVTCLAVLLKYVFLLRSLEIFCHWKKMRPVLNTVIVG
ncbi:hypothetical protein SUGI_0901520 [Cryptomeria japonica]|nr:hypothetical protein SUGI_0901520 [Cryptomeria japonica]